MDADKDPLKLIAQLSVDVVTEFKDKYPEEIVQAFSLVAKYMTIAGYSKNVRKDIDAVSNSQYCPLCHLYFHNDCAGCVLKDPGGVGCGHQYDGIYYALRNGTFLDVAFNVSGIIKKCLKEYINKVTEGRE